MTSSVEHYNRVACTAPVQCMELRRAHNACKRNLLQQALLRSGNLIEHCRILDLACGRGGDLNKVFGCLRYVGVDTADLALAELQRRAAQIGMCVEVVHGDAARASIPMGPFNLAICMFALHYFCDTKQHLQDLLQCTSSRLEQGGMLCGTFERHNDTDSWGVVHHAIVGDCVNALEWRVPWNKVVALALNVGLALVLCEPFYLTDRNADRNVYSFIFQQAQERCCDRTQTCALTEDIRARRLKS